MNKLPGARIVGGDHSGNENPRWLGDNVYGTVEYQGGDEKFELLLKDIFAQINNPNAATAADSVLAEWFKNNNQEFLQNYGLKHFLVSATPGKFTMTMVLADDAKVSYHLTRQQVFNIIGIK